MYFRFYVFILKFLGKFDFGVGVEVFVSFMKEVVEGFFVRGEEKNIFKVLEK